MNEESLFEEARLYLPKYLTPEDHRQLFQELKGFPEDFNYYLRNSALTDELLQGDGWRSLKVVNFETLEKKACSGMVLSNTCDVDSSNARHLPPKVVFCPIMSISKVFKTLRDNGLSEERTDDLLRDIRGQRVSSLFYLPSNPSIEESVAFLGDVHSHPLKDFLQHERKPLFTLSQSAFYLFVLKISIHFSRFQEDVRRFE